VIPFANASLQGSVNTLRTIKNNPKWALAASTPLGATSILAYINNKRFATSDKIPEYEYRYNWVFQIGEGHGKDGDFPIYIKFPKGPQGAVITAPIETMIRMAWMDNDRSVVESLLQTAGNMATSLSPVEPNLSGIMPPILSTATGLATNKDLFRGTNIVPLGEQFKPTTEQYGEKTSTLAVDIGKQFNVSPRLIDFAINDYFAGTGQTVNWLSSIALEALDINLRNIATRPAAERNVFNAP